MRLSELAARLAGVQGLTDSNFTAFCPVHDNHNTQALSVSAAADGKLLVKCHAGCSGEAIVAALGLEWSDLFPPHARLVSSNGAVPPFLRLWRESLPGAGTLAETYLQARGVNLAIPPSLRFLPRTVYQEAGQRQDLPAMVAPIQIDRTIIGIHRTYLSADGFGKAGVAKPKKMLGAAKGGAVRLAPVAERVGVAEGIETALAAMQADAIPMLAALSTTGMKEIVVPGDVKEVVIYADGDEPGLLAAATLAQRLLLNGVRVGIKKPPAGKDFLDLLTELSELAIRETPIEWQNPAVDKSLPTLNADGGDLTSALAGVASAIAKWNDPPRLFVNETTNKLVTISWRTPKKDESDRNAPYLAVHEVTLDAYRNIMAAAAHWVKYRRGGAEPSYPPMDTVRSAFADARNGHFLPRLRGIVSSPTVAPSGRFLKPGYDAETRLWYAADDDDSGDEGIDDEDPETLQAALSWFEDAVCDFLFETEGDKAHALSLFLLPFIREMIDGPTPLHVIEAPIAGTGKGLLARVLLRPTDSFRMMPETNEIEQEKHLVAACVNAWPAALLDNISTAVRSPMLASLVTSKSPELRLMGGYTMVKVTRVPIFVLTANNPSFSEENARRVARIRITSPIEQPEDREGFRHPYLEMWLEEERQSIRRAGVTMIKHWLKKGAPRGAGRLWGSFEAWSSVMGGVTEFLGYAGFGTARISRESIDTTESRWRGLFERWSEQYGDQPMKAADLAILANGIEDFFTEREIKTKTRAIGFGLKARKGRIFGQWRLDIASRAHGMVSWKLTKVG